MNFTDIAKELIRALDGIETEKTVRGVVQVFEGIAQGVHNQWEEHLAAETTETLMYDEVVCTCGNIIDISRKNSTIAVRIHQT
jgi:hypothetical protein